MLRPCRALQRVRPAAAALRGSPCSLPQLRALAPLACARATAAETSEPRRRLGRRTRPAAACVALPFPSRPSHPAARCCPLFAAHAAGFVRPADGHGAAAGGLARRGERPRPAGRSRLSRRSCLPPCTPACAPHEPLTAFELTPLQAMHDQQEHCEEHAAWRQQEAAYLQQ